MSVTLCWTLFNAYVPIFLRAFVPSSALVGVVMSLDNIAGMTLQPWFGERSDRTLTRFGRRLPYLMVGMPLAALAFPLLPLADTLLVLVFAIVAFDLSMSAFRAPMIALMPDLTPESLRSQGNAVMSVMGAVGALLALFAGAALYRLDPAYPFFGASIVLLVSLALVMAWVREPVGRERGGDFDGTPEPAFHGTPGASRGTGSSRDVLTPENPAAATSRGKRSASGGLWRAIRRLPREDRALLWTLFALFGWSLGQGSLETFFTTYAVVALGWDESTGAFMMGFFALAFLLGALPAGRLGARWGLHRALSRGLVGLAAVVAAGPFVRSTWAVAALLSIAGAAWSLVSVNAYPRAVELGSKDTVGATTGLYYFFTSLAASSGPPAAGAVMDLLGEPWLFGFSALSFAAAWLCLRQAGKHARRTGREGERGERQKESEEPGAIAAEGI